jgi:hypothetical protein
MSISGAQLVVKHLEAQNVSDDAKDLRLTRSTRDSCRTQHKIANSRIARWRSSSPTNQSH